MPNSFIQPLSLRKLLGDYKKNKNIRLSLCMHIYRAGFEVFYKTKVFYFSVQSPTAVSKSFETNIVTISLDKKVFYLLLLNTNVCNYASRVVYSDSPSANLMLFKIC